MRSSVASIRDRIGPTQVRPFDRRKPQVKEPINLVRHFGGSSNHRGYEPPPTCFTSRCSSCGASRSLVGNRTNPPLAGLLRDEPARSIGYVGTAPIGARLSIPIASESRLDQGRNPIF